MKSFLLSIRDGLVVRLKYPSDPQYRNWHFRESRKLLQFKNCHKDQGCFIIGNGPSLNKMDLSLLNDYYTFGLNKIFLIFKKQPLNLSYHVTVNPLVIQQSQQSFEQLNCPSFVPYRKAYPMLEGQKDIHYIMTGSPSPYTFSGNLLEAIHEGHTVTYVAMQIAFFMGFTKVFLIGVDHNFSYQGKPNEKQKLEGDDPNHFDPNYFKDQAWHLPDLEASELSYYLARFHYQRSNRMIYDATVDGKLTIFPKISFEEALKLCPRKK